MGELDRDSLVSELGGKSELDVLLEQLEELFAEGITAPDDALEVATVAGLAARLGASEQALSDVSMWRDEDGIEMVAEALDEVDLEALVEALDNLEGADEHAVEEAVSDFDDVVAAAAWCGMASRVRASATAVAAVVRLVPDPFAFMSSTGRDMARSKVVAEDLGLYDYWLAIAEAETWT